jgi:hypothetical protein
MPQRFVVPQFIDVEDKILGPLTVRQFLIMLITFVLLAILYRLLVFSYFLGAGLPLLAVGVILAFVKINGLPFHFFLLNLGETLRRPRLRVWDKELSVAELKMLMSATPPPPPAAKIRKEALQSSKLSELSLIVNTGGVYKPDEE